MKSKRIFIFLILIFFLIAVITTAFFLFSVANVEIEFSASQSLDLNEINESVKKYYNKNLFFIKEDSIKDDLSSFDYFEITDIEKKFPNTLKISMKERREIFVLETQSKFYKISDEGYVFQINNISNYGDLNNNLIKIKFDGVNVLTESKGEIIRTSKQNLVNMAFDIAKEINYSDCISEMKIISGAEKNDVILKTITGVQIVVYDALEDGILKIRSAFQKYENISDFDKTYGFIYVLKDYQGVISSQWSEVENI